MTPLYLLFEENNYESSAYQLLDPYWFGKCKDSIFENLSSILFKTLPNAHMTQELSAFKQASNKLYAVINIYKLWQNYEKLLPSSQQSLNCRRAFLQHQHLATKSLQVACWASIVTTGLNNISEWVSYCRGQTMIRLGSDRMWQISCHDWHLPKCFQQDNWSTWYKKYFVKYQLRFWRMHELLNWRQEGTNKFWRKYLQMFCSADILLKWHINIWQQMSIRWTESILTFYKLISK